MHNRHQITFTCEELALAKDCIMSMIRALIEASDDLAEVDPIGAFQGAIRVRKMLDMAETLSNARPITIV
jgi:hypothetical protein